MGRSHDIECEHCHAMYGGLEGPSECPCREIVSGGGLPTAGVSRRVCFCEARMAGECACGAWGDGDGLTAERNQLRVENDSLRARVAELEIECLDIEGWRASVDESMAQYERCKSERDSLTTKLAACEAEVASNYREYSELYDASQKLGNTAIGYRRQRDAATAAVAQSRLTGIDECIAIIQRRQAHYELYRTGDTLTTHPAVFTTLTELLVFMQAHRERTAATVSGEGESTRE